MKRAILCLFLAAALPLSAAQVTAYLFPGPWALCAATNNPLFCGMPGDVVGSYQLFMHSDAGPLITGYQWTVTGLLEDGTLVVRSGSTARAAEDYPGSGGYTVQYLSFGGVLHGLTIVAYGVASVPQYGTERTRQQ